MPHSRSLFSKLLTLFTFPTLLGLSIPASAQQRLQRTLSTPLFPSVGAGLPAMFSFGTVPRLTFNRGQARSHAGE
jgi:hypothetical protein